MAIMTVSVDDEVEKKFRKAAGMKYGKRKGYLGEALTEAMENWSETSAKEKVLELLEKGFRMGGLKYKNRGELHGR